MGSQPVEPEIIGKDRDSYGRKVESRASNFRTYDPQNENRNRNSDLSSIEMDSTKALDKVKNHLEKAIGHAYFEVNELSNERLSDQKWAVEVEIDYLFRDKTESKRFEIKNGVITSVTSITSE